MIRSLLFLALLFTLVDVFLTGRFSLPAVAAGWLVLLAGGRWSWQFFLLLRLGVWLFFAYFGRLPGPVDLKLFWLHPFETFEALGGMATFFALPLAGWAVLALLGLFFLRKKARPLPLVVAGVLLWLSLGPSSSGGRVRAFTAEALPVPTRRSDISLVLIIGESLGYDADIARRFKRLDIGARPIYPAATATDTSVALLLNGATRLPLTPQKESNLFALAKAGGFATRFCSAQPRRWLGHLQPLLGRNFIDESRLELGDDLSLLECLRLPEERPALIVLQQIGEHAPYTYYPPPHAGDPAANYRRSLDHTFRFYRRIVEWANAQTRPVVVLGTADHGELRGQGGRWGHNAFVPAVMRVPFWVVHNLPDGLPFAQTVRCHHDLYRLAAWVLGCDYAPLPPEKIRVWGTMPSGEDGFRSVSACAPETSGRACPECTER